MTTNRVCFLFQTQIDTLDTGLRYADDYIANNASVLVKSVSETLPWFITVQHRTQFSIFFQIPFS